MARSWAARRWTPTCRPSRSGPTSDERERSMKAVVMRDGGLAVSELPDPSAEGWAVVEVKAAGVCGSELHFLDGMIPPPFEDFVLGHEIAGVVVSAPQGAAVAPGDR